MRSLETTSRGEESPVLLDYASERLKNLCKAAAFGEHTPVAVNTLRRLLHDWNALPRGAAAVQAAGPRWVSDISDDNTPIELSVAITDGAAEVRALFEPQAKQPTVAAHWEASMAFYERLASEFDADLGRLRQVEKLFEPRDATAAFAAWGSAVFARGKAPSFKAYLNPCAHGSDNAPAVVQEALARLGMQEAWPGLRSILMRREAPLDELKYFALDLTEGELARVKVYVRHHAATPEEVEQASSVAANHRPGEVLEFARAMVGEGRMDARAPFTCASILGEDPTRPATATSYVPVCAYHRNDAEVRRTVVDYLARKGLDSHTYESILDGYPNRPLEAGTGMQPWCAIRRFRERLRLTVYLAIEANRVYQPGTVPAPTPDMSSLVASRGA